MTKPIVRVTLGAVLGVALASCGGGSNGGGGGGTCGTPGGTAQAVSGIARYQRVNHTGAHALDYTNISLLPIRGATVEVRRGNATATCTTGTVLGTGVTDNSGNYSIDVTPNEEVKVCVRAETVQTGVQAWDVQVVDNTEASALYILETAGFCTTDSPQTQDMTAATTWSGTAYTSRAGAPFAILDSVYTAILRIVAVQASFTLDPLDLNWSVNNTTTTAGGIADGGIGTSHYSNDEIYILGDEDNDTDEFDGHVVLHEFGHYIEDNLSRSDSIGYSHSGGELLDLRVAYSEGFGNAFAGIVTDDPVYEDSFGNMQGSGFDIDVESDVVTDAQEGWYSETTVQGLLYDLYDANADVQTPTGGTTFTDAVALGLGPLWNVWVGAQRTTPAVTSVFPFLTALRAANPGSAAAIDVIASARNIDGTDAFGDGETNDGGLGTLGACTHGNYALPVHVPYTAGVTGPIGVATTNVEGEVNKLGVRRFITFTTASAGNHSFTVAGAGFDPDATLYNAGVRVGSVHQVFGNESWTQVGLPAGTYVLEVYAFENYDEQFGDISAGGDFCIQVTIT